MVRCNVLTFGDFTTKSGRKTPFFINTGNYRTGSQIGKLGEFYAAAINDRLGKDFDLLYGPAYKGIPLVVTTAAALASKFGHDVAFCFNRKEAKDHGEGGVFIGRKPADGDQVLIVEDVVTAGTSVRESTALLRAAARLSVCGLAVSVNRMERGTGGKSALAELSAEFGLKAFAIVTLDDIIVHLRGRTLDSRVVLDDACLERIADYRRTYGAAVGVVGMRKMSDNPPVRFPDRPIAEAEFPWFVVHVKPRQEKALVDDCRRLAIEYYLPMITKVPRRRDNNKPRKSILPLFPGYVSCTGVKETYYRLYATGRIANIIEIKHQKRFIAEISQIYSLLEKGVPLEPCLFTFGKGTEVEVQAGPLRGTRGVVASVKNADKLILSVEGLGYAMLTVDATLVKPVDPAHINGGQTSC